MSDPSPVITDNRGTRVLPTSLSRWWTEDRPKYGLDGWCLHEFRHTYFTLLAISGVHLKVMQELAGHSEDRGFTAQLIRSAMGKRLRAKLLDAIWRVKMQLGFSMVGVGFLAMLFIPNIKWARNQPLGYEVISGHERKVLLVFERVGQVLATISAVVFVCPQGFSFPWLIWLITAFLSMLLYEVAWARYFMGGERLAGMYQPLGPIPVPIATLPVTALALLGIWYQSPITVAAAVTLGVGHIGIHLEHLRELSAR